MTPDDLRQRVGADPGATALLFDFDGTLSPIVDDPASAAPVDGALDLLDRLSARFARVAVISGRPRSFLASRLGPTIHLSGLYGLETRSGGVDVDHPEAERWRPVVWAVAADVDLPAGVVVESKGLSLTIHYRQAPDAADEVRSWATAAARRTGLEVRAAKASVELHPPVRVDKGTSVLALADGCSTVVYVGDDLGDLPAFAAVDQLCSSGVDAIKIAAGGIELPTEIEHSADLVVAGPAAVVALFAPLA